jgi:lysophospholipase L1-like esterase
MNVNILFMGDSITTGVSSDNKIHTNFLGYRQLMSGVIDKAYNFSIPGLTTGDLLNQLSKNIDLIEVNKINQTQDHVVEEGISIEEIFPIDIDNITLIDAIKKCEALMLTVGGSDVRAYISNVDGEVYIDHKNVKKHLELAVVRKRELFEKILAINPNIKIIDVGLYFPFQEKGDEELNSIFAHIVEELALKDVGKKLFNVKNTSQDIYIDNANDIHPSKSGYHRIFSNIINQLYFIIYD